MGSLFSRGLLAAGLALVLGGPACAQGSSDLGAGDDGSGLGGDSGGAGDGSGASGGDGAARHDGGASGDGGAMSSDASAAQDGSPIADASVGQDGGTVQPDASTGQDSGTVQPDASTGPSACPTDAIHSAEAAIELAKAMPKTCITPAQCGPGECCYVPLVCIAQ